MKRLAYAVIGLICVTAKALANTRPAEPEPKREPVFAVGESSLVSFTVAREGWMDHLAQCVHDYTGGVGGFHCISRSIDHPDEDHVTFQLEIERVL